MGIDDVGLPGLLYVRVRQAPDGRLRICELYIDATASEPGLRQQDLRALRLGAIETFLNESPPEEFLLYDMNEPGPDLSTLATYFRTRINPAAWGQTAKLATWAQLSLAAQWDKSPDPKPRRAKRQAWVWKKRVVTQDRDFRLAPGAPDEGLTPEFLHDVARAYAAAVARGERPNVALAAQTGYTPKAAQKWVYTARARKIMPKASKKGGTG